MNTKTLLGGAAPLALASLIWSAPVLAQERGEEVGGNTGDGTELDTRDLRGPIIVTASNATRTIDTSIVPITSFITAPKIARDRQFRDIGEALRDIPSVAVSAVAGQTQIRLRGSEANHVLVLIDGIEVSDPFAGEFDIGTLQAEIGSRADVILGPQSALFGSDAIGGVVSYSSARGCSGIFDGYAEGGTNDTFNASARTGLCEVWGEINASATYVSTDGEPNARPIGGNGVRNIGRESTTLSANTQFFPTESLTIRAAGRYVRTDGDFNDADFDATSATFGFTIDTPETRFENEAIYALVGAELLLLDDRWSHDLSAQIADITRDSFGPFGRTFGSEGERLKASYVSSLELVSGSTSHTITLAADWEEERYRNTDPFGFAFTGTRTNENFGLVGEYQLDADRFLLSAAIRHDINDNFADTATFKLAGSFDITDATVLRGSVGTGIKNPGFYELFGFVDGRFIGNANLRPEKSTGWEIGVEQELIGGAVFVSATYFESELDGEIFTSFPAPIFVATPDNRTTTSTSRGVELRMTAELTDNFTLNAAYTYLDAEEDGVTEVRRPESIASASLDWSSPGDDARASLVVRHNGEAQDLAFTDPSFVPVRVTLDDYTLVNLYGEFDLTGNVSVFARAENLLDDRYEQVFSFVSQGRTVTAGVRASF